jgi:anaerobic magnesium-protoporphyrin IX monomethyl ester cyclase
MERDVIAEAGKTAALSKTSRAPSARPARTVQSDQTAPQAQSLNRVRHRVLLVDLNNFASFPTLAVGILVASLRNAGFDARVLVPLAHDVPATERERREGWRQDVMRRIHLSSHPALRFGRDRLREAYYSWQNRPHPRVLREVERAIDQSPEGRPEAILLSAYLQHFTTVVEIGKLAARKGIPVLLGGPAFNTPEVVEAWRTIPGIVGVVGGEVDLVIPDIVATAITGGNLLAFDGVALPDGRRSPPAPPLRKLDRSPVPDFTDFPWDRYRVRIIPIMTGRGCQWDRCVFCSDVVSVSGRTYRTRSIESVVHEMREQSRRHATNNFLFLDLKLNSNPSLFRGIAEHAQEAAPGAQWIGTVHVDRRRDNGLSRPDLKAAVASGMRRVSFGLESGSQRLLDLLDKGSTVDGNSDFIRTAHSVGLSVRCSMFLGFPGETTADVEETARFLEEHAPYLDRVRCNAFSILEDTPVWNAVHAGDERYPAIRLLGKDAKAGKAQFVNTEIGSKDYRRARSRVLRAVFAINRRELRQEAQVFDGLM